MMLPHLRVEESVIPTESAEPAGRDPSNTLPLLYIVLKVYKASKVIRVMLKGISPPPLRFLSGESR
jgi:hypothetical protein